MGSAYQNSITLESIKAYLDLHAITDQMEREDFLYVLDEMDAVYVKFANRKKD